MIDRRVVNAFKYKAFSLQGPRHETHVSTVGRQAQADARLSRPHEIHWRPQSALGAARQGPRAPYPLNSAAVPRGIRPFRLTGTGAFDALFKTGRRRAGEYVELVAAPALRVPGRVGLVVGKKALALAVDRNRVRRMLRAAVATARPTVLDYDVILRLKRGCARSEFRAVATDAVHLLSSLGSPAR
jgi:ribonuclease P protein component